MKDSPSTSRDTFIIGLCALIVAVAIAKPFEARTEGTSTTKLKARDSQCAIAGAKHFSTEGSWDDDQQCCTISLRYRHINEGRPVNVCMEIIPPTI